MESDMWQIKLWFFFFCRDHQFLELLGVVAGLFLAFLASTSAFVRDYTWLTLLRSTRIWLRSHFQNTKLVRKERNMKPGTRGRSGRKRCGLQRGQWGGRTPSLLCWHFLAEPGEMKKFLPVYTRKLILRCNGISYKVLRFWCMQLFKHEREEKERRVKFCILKMN